ncbi:EpsD family peptidyl-prolyl cis-trans isomerase [Jeongeupia naejangsanensis]|uniref:EpsD family peptidyl-prolyl cis-trans isomerase n=1 Tax=Jeongeupia naejangsanensis TaxID=613195 RepID=A0ABS2BHR7_9NEIS|nr:EpsD family peptidyl-prolyl cis-trans isomerase [Jeongeupia naejangsanensis]MBM3115149.1 EpsD family peptidyl-prolyl cis-trans isomerase [Jeongeupia naejangsanensis]
MKTLYRNTAVLAAIVLGLTACKDDGEKKSPSQVVARVGDAEITVHQLNYLLAQQANPGDAAVKQRVLDGLVDQELLVQKAVELKLDRDPDVVQAVEAARRQILARAAAEREIGKPAEPAQAQIDAFYAAHPQLFAERKLYDFAVFALAANALKPEIEQALQHARNAAETAAVLQQAGVNAQPAESQKAPEQLPLPLLPKVAAMKNGDIIAVPDGDKVLLLQLKGSTPAALQAAEVQGAIKQYLLVEQGGAREDSKLKALRGATKIEYLQRFATADGKDESLKSGLQGLN